MKTVTKISTLIMISSSMLVAEVRYDVESAKIEFELNTTDKDISAIGKQRVLIDNYGERELVEVSEVKKTNGKVHKVHTLSYINGSVAYDVNFDEKQIHRMTDYMGDTFGLGKDAKTLKKYHKKIGTDTVAGKSCDIWEFAKGLTECIYKGLPLRYTYKGKVEKVATKVELNIDLTKEDFKLPDYLVGGVYGVKPKKYTQSELEALDNQEKNKNKLKEKEQDNAMNLMKEAYKEAGVKEGKSPTAEQMQIAKEYMQTAMFPIQKKKFLEKMKGIGEKKNCLEKANNLRDANNCDSNIDEWNSMAKEESLKEISMFVSKILPCVKKAQNGKEMDMCFPDDE